MLTCVICDGEAVTTAAGIPVCYDHYICYCKEAQSYWRKIMCGVTLAARPFYDKLVARHVARGGKFGSIG